MGHVALSIAVDRAWILLRKDGYNDKTIELPSAGWKHSYQGERYDNPVPETLIA